jgi:tetratricopeptide (TPR) repeat protein
MGVQWAQNQFQQGLYLGNQAMMAEQMGNPGAAVPMYDQAIAMIAQSMTLAMQSGMPVPDNVFFCLAQCHFSAARAKAAVGWPQAVPMHLMQAREAIGRAISINPGFFQYHSAAGVVLLAQGDMPGAAQEFQNAVQLNPMDAWSQWMLASLHQSQGQAGLAQQYYAAAQQVQPNLPAPQQFQAPSGGSGKASQKDWVELVGKLATLGNTVVGALQGGGGGAQTPAGFGFGGY